MRTADGCMCPITCSTSVAHRGLWWRTGKKTTSASRLHSRARSGCTSTASASTCASTEFRAGIIKSIPQRTGTLLDDVLEVVLYLLQIVRVVLQHGAHKML